MPIVSEPNLWIMCDAIYYFKTIPNENKALQTKHTKTVYIIQGIYLFLATQQPLEASVAWQLYPTICTQLIVNCIAQ